MLVAGDAFFGFLARGAIPAESFELSERDSRGGASWATVAIPEGPTLGSGTRYAIAFFQARRDRARAVRVLTAELQKEHAELEEAVARLQRRDYAAN